MSFPSPPPGFCQDCAISCGLDRERCARCEEKQKAARELLERIGSRLGEFTAEFEQSASEYGRIIDQASNEPNDPLVDALANLTAAIDRNTEALGPREEYTSTPLDIKGFVEDLTEEEPAKPQPWQEQPDYLRFKAKKAELRALGLEHRLFEAEEEGRRDRELLRRIRPLVAGGLAPDNAWRAMDRINVLLMGVHLEPFPSRSEELLGATLGERIRVLRLDREWKLRELAERSGVSVSYLSQLEREEKADPSARFLQRIASVLEVSMEQLLGPEPTTKETP